MEKRALIAVVLSILILVVWSLARSCHRSGDPSRRAPRTVRSPSEAPRRRDGAGRDRALRAGDGGAEPTRRDDEPPSTGRGRVAAPRSTRRSDRQPLLRGRADQRGGGPLSWKLTDYTTPDGRTAGAVPAVPGRRERSPLAIDARRSGADHELNQALYRVEREQVSPTEGGPRRADQLQLVGRPGHRGEQGADLPRRRATWSTSSSR